VVTPPEQSDQEGRHERVPILRVAGHRPSLGAGEREQLRAISSRARITATSFVNSYDYGDLVWRQVEDLIIMRNASAYDQAAALLVDVGEIAAAGGRRDKFDGRIAELHVRHARKGQFIARLKAAGL
jgi:hypothetical protein